jgi:hypothetical protein
MSTRSSIHYGRYKNTDFHLFEDFADESVVFLELRGEVDFSSSTNSVTIGIPIAVWETIRSGRHSLLNSWVVGKTDAEIKQHAIDFVTERMEKYANGNKFYGIAGLLIYGSIDEPPIVQIENGIKSMIMERDEIAKILEEIQSLQKK